MVVHVKSVAGRPGSLSGSHHAGASGSLPYLPGWPSLPRSLSRQDPGRTQGTRSTRVPGRPAHPHTLGLSSGGRNSPGSDARRPPPHIYLGLDTLASGVGRCPG